MGVGTPIDLLEAVHRGVDMFDCILPTAMGQQGVAYTRSGKVELRRTVYKFADVPLDETCNCPTCREYSRGYLHHLIKTHEYAGAFLVGQHNLQFYYTLMHAMRTHIIRGDFRAFYNSKKDDLIRRDDDNPKMQPKVKPLKSTSTLGKYEVIRQEAGFYSIYDTTSGETMHSVVDPQIESKQLYADQSDFQAHLQQEHKEPLVIWDVGLGAASNAMAAVQAIELLHREKPITRPVQMISFENDLDALRLVLKNPTHFPHVWHAAPSSLEKKGYWQSLSPPISWKLITGDFSTACIAAPSPDIIYYDMFSPNVERRLWSVKVFSQLFSLCNGKHARLITYTISTKIRAALLAAGFTLCYGKGSGPKTETTLAFTAPEEAYAHPRPMGREWLERWKRSSAQTDEHVSEDEKEGIKQKVMHHHQFAEGRGRSPGRSPPE